MSRPEGSAPRDTFAFLKRTTALDELLVKSIALDGGWLVPLADLHRVDEPTIRLLGRWRSEHMAVHPSQFTVTDDGTRRWLEDAVLDNPERIMFFVADGLGRPIGQLGLSIVESPPAAALPGESAGVGRAVELGYVIRGESGVPGLMSRAVTAAVDWCRELLAPNAIYALTFSDNERALAFFARCGAVTHGTIPLVRHDTEDRVEYRSPASPEERPDRSFTVLTFPSRNGPATARIELAGPSITAREATYALDAARHGWGARRNGYLDALARDFAEAVGVRYAVPTSSCTGAMHLALLTRGIGPGDEVVLPDLTWVATANAVALTGATPVFADIEADSWGLAPDALQHAITERTRAVIPVHLYGYPARIDRLRTIADEHGLFVLEDAAAAVGAAVGDRAVGSWGDMAAFSFQGAKVVVAGEGGMLVTDDEALFRRAQHLLDHARGGLHPFWADEVTPKYKMANVQAALALAQTQRLPWLLERKRRAYAWYRDELEDVSGIRLHAGAVGTSPTHWMPSIMLESTAACSRDDVLRELGRRDIDSRPTFPTLSSLPMWTRQAPGATPVATAVAARGINLPSGAALQRADVARVGQALREVLRRA